MKYLGLILIMVVSLVSITPYVAFGQNCAGQNNQTACDFANGCMWDTDQGCISDGSTNQSGGGNTGQPDGGSGGSVITNPIQSNTFGELMAKIAATAAKIGLPLVSVFMIYAGFLFVSARGNEEQLSKAKSTFFWAIIGALLVVGAFAIATAIENFSKQL